MMGYVVESRRSPIPDDRSIPKVHFSEISERLEIEYPCRWLYKVIGTDEEAVRLAVLELIDVTGVTIELSNRSSRGTYVSLNIEVTVQDEQQRVAIYEALRGHRDVRMVL